MHTYHGRASTKSPFSSYDGGGGGSGKGKEGGIRSNGLRETYGRVMKQALGEDDGGYSSKNRFDRPFHAADSRCAEVVFDRVVAQKIWESADIQVKIY
jgi:hypothetical protein